MARSEAARTRPARYVVRSAGTVVAFWVGIGVLAVVLGIPLAQADWHDVIDFLAPCLLLAWAFWFALFRPAVHYDTTKAVIVNLGRTWVLPWGHVTGVAQGVGMIFYLGAGKPVRAAGAPAPRKPGLIASTLDRRTRPPQDVNREAEILDGLRRSAPPSDEPVSVKWDAIPLVIGGVLVVAVVLEFVTGF